MERVSRKPMITIGIAFVNNNGKFALKSLGTTIGLQEREGWEEILPPACRVPIAK